MTAQKQVSKKAMKSLIPSEHDEQVAFVEWLEVNRYRFSSIPNGGGRSKRQAQILKEEGVRGGLPDILVIVNNQLVWIEMKKRIYKNRKNGGLSDSQIEWHQSLNKCANTQVFTCYGADEARSVITGIK